MSRFGPLNWKEVARLAPLLDSEIRGAFVDRVVVPARAQLPDGFLKGEWVIRLTGKCLLLSVRPRAPYFALLPGKGPEAAERGTRSGFDLALSKYLRGAKVVAVRALPRERALEIEFAGQLVLLVLLIPATPEAVLIDRAKDEVLHRSRNLPPEKFVAPDGTHAPPDLAARDLTLAELRTQIEASLTTEAFALRRTRAEKLARESRKKFADRERQSRTAGEEAAQEADWQKYGELLKASLPNPPPLVRGVRKLLDYATGETIEVPGDPKLDAAAQVAKYFSLAKRQAKRATESRARRDAAAESTETFARALEQLAALDAESADWSALEAIEARLGIAAPSAEAVPTKATKARAAWPGRSFRSRDGWPMWVGRTKDENLELTFKCAKGNDVWMHVRGKPGAHLVIPVPSGKSVPLETLLDAAQLVLHYCGGENWSTTDIDYTFKKYVKRIRDSSEASYTNNKTLLIKPDAERRKRLLATE